MAAVRVPALARTARLVTDRSPEPSEVEAAAPFEAFVCPQCGHWEPARGAHSFFTCDGRGRMTRDSEGYFVHSPQLHNPAQSVRVALVPDAARERSRNDTVTLAEVKALVRRQRSAWAEHLEPYRILTGVLVELDTLARFGAAPPKEEV